MIIVINASKLVLLPHSGESPLNMEAIERLVLNAARDYYNNADTGDKDSGLMKKALLCLHMLPVTNNVQKELDLIDIAYDIYRYAPNIAPIQIRFAPSRLNLIQLLIEENSQTYEQMERSIKTLSVTADALLVKLGCQQQLAAQLTIFTSLLRVAIQRRNKEMATATADQLYRIMKQHPFNDLNNIDRYITQVEEELSTWQTGWKCIRSWSTMDDLLSLDEQLYQSSRLLEICPSDALTDTLEEWHRIKEAQQPSTLLCQDETLALTFNEMTTPSLEQSLTYHEFYQPSIVSSERETIDPIDLRYHRWIVDQLTKSSTNQLTVKQANSNIEAYMASVRGRDHALWLSEQLWHQNIPGPNTFETSPYEAMLMAYGIGLQCIAQLVPLEECRSISEYSSGDVFKLIQQWCQSTETSFKDTELYRLATKANEYLKLAQSSQESDLIKHLSAVRSVDVNRFEVEMDYARHILTSTAEEELSFSLTVLYTLSSLRGIDEEEILKARLNGLFNPKHPFDVFLSQIAIMKNIAKTNATQFHNALIALYPTILGTQHGLLRQFFILYQTCQNELKADLKDKQQITLRIQLLGELVAASALDKLDFHILVEVGHTGNIERLHEAYKELLSEETVFTLAALSPR
ncbi:hypothetical protein BDF19DRAFT_39585 [Syncephalis fuscata]|nr:hypothetical protein BDF19DRAFT_39585 [Syncephalis fuscata]